MAPPPVVTGLSPIEGPPGTRITIRGENFGNKPSDLIGSYYYFIDMFYDYLHNLQLGF